MTTEFGSPQAVVLGGGPGGAIAARDLARSGLDVLLVERSGEPSHLPETLGPDTAAALDRAEVGAWRKALRPYTRVVVCLEDSRVRLEIGLHQNPERATGARLDRDALDAHLREEAARAGARLAVGYTVMSVKPPEDGQPARVHLSSGAGEVCLPTPMVVDATGKSAVLARSQGWMLHAEQQLDPRDTIFTHVRPERPGPLTDLDQMTLYSLDSGYLFVIPITTDRVSVGAVLAHGSEQSPSSQERFHRALAQAPEVRRLVEHGTGLLPVIEALNRPWVSSRRAGSWFVLVGDAARFQDPFLGEGTLTALTEGQAAAQFVARVLAQEPVEDAVEGFLRCSLGGDSVRDSAAAPLEPEEVTRLSRALVDPHIPYLLHSLLHGRGDSSTRLRDARDRFADPGRIW